GTYLRTCWRNCRATVLLLLQAEYLRVPFADYNCVPLPEGSEHEQDFALLADIFPTGYHGTELAGVRPGDTVAVYGAGPVGLMAAYAARLKGASRILCVDKIPSRLDLAEQIGAEPIDFSKGSPPEQIADALGADGVDRGVDAVGYQATAEGARSSRRSCSTSSSRR